MRTVLLVGAAYCAVGLLFGGLAARAASPEAMVGWRRAAWLVSAITFGAHVWHAQVRRASPVRTTSLHAAGAAALGAFGLAVAANVHALFARAHDSGGLASALVVWPVVVALPAYVAALAAARLLARARERAA